MAPYCAANSYSRSYDSTRDPEEEPRVAVPAASIATRSLEELRKDVPINAFWNVPLEGPPHQGQFGRVPMMAIDLKQLHAVKIRHEPLEPFKFAGYLGTIVASLFASLSVLCIKLLPVENSIQEMAKASMYRGLFLALFCSIAICCQGESFSGPRGEYVINFVRATLGAFSTLLVYMSIEFITMGECSALVFSSPVWTCILGFVILKEPLPISLILAIPMSFLGIILLADPELLVFIRDELSNGFELQKNHSSGLSAVTAQRDNTTTWRSASLAESLKLMDYEERLQGIAIALVASFFMSGVIISFKYRNTTSIATCSFQYGAALAIVAAGVQVVVGFGALPATSLEWILILCIGLFSFGCQTLFQWSLQYVPAGIFSVMRSLDIGLSFVLGAAFLNDVVLWTSVAGTILIVIVVAMLIFNDNLKEALKSCCCMT